ncbi:MAG: glycosyltransferase family 2 protein [bacterium]
MDNKIFLSIAIPTYNRAEFLENLLNNIMPQAKELEGSVEVCISNNSSTDNTKEVIVKFQSKYPNLIKYSENNKNLGVDENIIKVLEMCSGDFIWTLGDDDSIIDNGLAKVANFIKKNCNNDTGLIVLRVNSYFTDKRTGQRITFINTLEENKPDMLKIDRKDIIGLNFPQIAFISVLIFNNKLLKETLKSDRAVIEKGIGTYHEHMLIFALMFLKYPNISGIAFNKEIVCQELSQYKHFIEDTFTIHYKVQKKLNSLLLSSKYMNNNYAPLIIDRDKRLRRIFVIDLLIMRAFRVFNYSSYFGCLKLFFQYSAFIDSLLFSLVFSTLFLIPSAILILLYKGLLMVKYGKNWKSQWVLKSNAFYIISQGARRQSA